ncbi:MAG: ABC transporter permease [Thermomicrobiales bacterium]|nr:ABC transporter permease [Thermomicrobiales bacterium]
MKAQGAMHFFARRLVQTVPVLFFISALTFGLLLLLPGDPVLGLLGPGVDIDSQAVDEMRAELNLDKPIPVQYATWLGNVLKGDLGRSAATKQPVSDAILSRLPVSAFLTLYAVAIMLLIALPLGILSAVKHGTGWDLLASAISVFGLAVPGFWLAILMIMFLAVRLDWLPASGYVSPRESLPDSLRYLLMPAIAMGAAGAGTLTRQLRSSLLEVMRDDYIRTARAKGVRGRAVVYRHALRNALIPSTTMLGLIVGQLIGGSLIIESIFLVPGMGSLLVTAIFTRDFPIVQAGTLVIAVIVVLINLGVDVLYGVLDPRID